MRHALGLALAVLMMGSVGWARTTNPAERELLQLENDWKQAIVTLDAAFLEGLYAADYLGTDADGVLWGKKEEIETALFGTFSLKSFKLEDMKARVYGDVAVVTGLNTIRGMNSGMKLTRQDRFTDVFVKREGRWQLVSNHTTTVDPLSLSN